MIQQDDEEEQNIDEAIIGSYRTRRRAHDAGLSILAAGHHYWVKLVEGRFLLVVKRRHADLLKREIDIAERKNRFWPPTALELPSNNVSKLPTLAVLTTLSFIFYQQGIHPEIETRGMLNATAIATNNEWWRTVTAITLHADIGHLSGNLFGLSIFAYLACRYFGNGLAWLSIIIAATLANITNTLLHNGESFNSLGASTAVFAALGLLTAYPLAGFIKSRIPVESRDWIIPFLGGCVIFAWMGGGEPPVDVGGHLLSFLYGFLLSLPIALFTLQSKQSKNTQTILLGSALLLPLICWTLALKN